MSQEENKKEAEQPEIIEHIREGYQPGVKKNNHDHLQFGYQPERGNLDPNNPPHGVSGVPSFIPKASGVSEKKEEYTPLKGVAQSPVDNKKQEEKPE